MNVRSMALSLVLSISAAAAMLLVSGCKAPGKPTQAIEVGRPDEEMDFATLYKQNCAACHGENGKNGASISLANPVYLAVAGEGTIAKITAAGVPGTQMPGFGKSAGGLLTDQQIAVLAHGIAGWGNVQALGGATAPAYASASAGDAAAGQKTFTTFCARCHGADGGGLPQNKVGSIVDPAYLALVSDQYLRSSIIAGRPENGMPDWRSHVAGRPMSEQEIADTVAWLALHRLATPGQPYQQHQ